LVLDLALVISIPSIGVTI